MLVSFIMPKGIEGVAMKLYRVSRRWMMLTANYVGWFGTLDELFNKAKELGL